MDSTLASTSTPLQAGQMLTYEVKKIFGNPQKSHSTPKVYQIIFKYFTYYIRIYTEIIFYKNN